MPVRAIGRESVETMAKTCLVCGEKAGSAEHIFPAALGGRRTNRGIYCTPHNKGYGPLAEALTRQLEVFNAQLGVVQDHSRRVRPAAFTELSTGRRIEITDTTAVFGGPDTIEPGEHTLAFSSLEQAQAWAARQARKGMKVDFIGQGQADTYLPGVLHAQITLGGPTGLRAIGYIGQTFLAHAFGDIARHPGLKPFIDFTYQGGGDPVVWWDHAPPPQALTSHFPFGHRIVVGVDAAQGVAYGRVSLFSSLHFAMVFGAVAGFADQTRIFDIDPLALKAPADLHESVPAQAWLAPTRPLDMASEMTDEITSGRALARIETLFGRIQDREREFAAAALHDQITRLGAIAPHERRETLFDLVWTERQRVLGMLRRMVDEFSTSDAGAGLRRLGLDPGRLVASDPAASDGLTEDARGALLRACVALSEQMADDMAGEGLTMARLRHWISSGEAHAVVLRAALEPMLRTLV